MKEEKDKFDYEDILKMGINNNNDSFSSIFPLLIIFMTFFNPSKNDEILKGIEKELNEIKLILVNK